MQLNVERLVPQQGASQPPNYQGLLFVLSAPSGTGKDTIIKTLKEQGMDFHVVSSVTTRHPRLGESDGNPYHFVDQETFNRMVANNELLEYAKVHGNWYGQPRKPIRDHLQAGKDVLLKIDVQGAATVRRKVPDAIFIFLAPESVEELAQRLDERKTETSEERQRRLADAQLELAEKDRYDYIILNRQGHLEEAVDKLRAIMLAEHCRVRRRQITI
ncbi:MAG TPA: guanylate kinase [Ktedonobacteraceae bacterium]|jgi:guanylate kinase|nr:guanylate kinase [Ktedonobacteraceae bacterium]